MSVRETRYFNNVLDTYSGARGAPRSPVTRILCGGEGVANEAKVDQTTEMYFLLSDPFI